MAGEIRFKFNDYHDSEGVAVKHVDGKEVILNQTEGVRPLIVKEEVAVKGRSLEELIKNAASTIKPRIAEEGDVIVEKKIPIVSEDETKIGAENVPERKELAREGKDVDKYKKKVRKVTSDVTIAIGKEKFNELEEERDLKSVILGIFSEARREVLERKDFDLEDGDKLKEEIKNELFESIASRPKGEAQERLLKICKEVFGIEEKEDEAQEPVNPAEKPETVASEGGKEEIIESQEQKERRELIENIFSKIFDSNNPEYKEIKFKTVKGGNTNVATSLRNGWFKPGTGLMGALVEKFLRESADVSEENFKAFCLENIDAIEVFNKKGEVVRTSENVKTAMKLACGFKEKEKEQEISDAEFEKIDTELTNIVNAYETKIRISKENKLNGEKSEEITAWQRKRLVETINGYGDLLDRYDEGERSAKLLAEYSKHLEDMRKLEKEIFPREKKNGTNAEKKNPSFDEYAERIKHGKEWRIKDAKEGKAIPAFEFRNFYVQGLLGEKIVELKEYFNREKAELEAVLTGDDKTEKKQEKYLIKRLEYLKNAIGATMERIKALQPGIDELKSLSFYVKKACNVKKDGFNEEYLKKLDIEIEKSKKELEEVWNEKSKEFYEYGPGKLKEHIETTIENLSHQLAEYASAIKEAKKSELYSNEAKTFFDEHTLRWTNINEKSEKAFQEFAAGKIDSDVLKEFEDLAHEVLEAFEEFERGKDVFVKEQNFENIPEGGFEQAEHQDDLIDKEPDFESFANGGFEKKEEIENDFENIPEGGFEKSQYFEEPIDSHSPFGKEFGLNDVEQKAFEEVIGDAPEIAKFLIAEYEKDGILDENDDVEEKIKYVRPRAEKVVLQLLKEDYGVSAERATMLAKEIANHFHL